MSKGDWRRPSSIPKDQYDKNYEAVFGKKKLNVWENPDEPPEAGPEEPFWTGPGYRGEYQCPHGVGHGTHIHGCDGCCSRPDFPLGPMSSVRIPAVPIDRRDQKRPKEADESARCV
jgi:hypothetical protein